MRPTRVRKLCSPLLVFWLSVFALYANGGKNTDEVQIGDTDPISIRIDQLQSGKFFFRVWNPTSVSHTLGRTRTTDFHLRDSHGNEMPNAISVQPFDGALSSLESIMLRVSADQNVVFSPGVYSGFLVLDETTPQPKKILKAVQITVPSAQPLLSNMTLWVRRWVVGSSVRDFTFDVPLVQKSVSSANAQVGVLQRTNAGGLAEVLSVASATAGSSSVHLRISELPYAGKYDGSAQIGPGDSSKVVLTVYVQDVIIWPMLAALLGVVIALWGRRAVLLGVGGLNPQPSAFEGSKSAVAFLTAVIVGLNRYYFGKAFGTASDYFTMFLVGTGANLALDVLVFSVSLLRLKQRSL